MKHLIVLGALVLCAVAGAGCVSSAQAAPKYVGTFSVPGPDGGLTSNVLCVGNTNQTIEIKCRRSVGTIGAAGCEPWCFRTCTNSTCVANCVTDYDPMPTTIQVQSGLGDFTLDGGGGSFQFQSLGTGPIPLGLDKCVDVMAIDGGSAISGHLRLYRDDPNL